MRPYAFPCPYCGSADVRRSRRQGLGEIPKMLLGVYPFRCLGCGERFFGNIWLLSTGGYTNCPRCLRLDVHPSMNPDGHLSAWSRLRMAWGAHAYRCMPCRRSFISFRQCMNAVPEQETATDEVTPNAGE